ncbi:putative membrane protein YphA (DoxX/SURF4 family) [Chryseobacterium bernardetii]|uniref:DoxX-like protein n=3 Tax=Chryseobacterium TaxID=59732 RepID=A0A543EFP3_9FLAO|nr:MULTISPECIES: DoxX family protein [Chryseobacterium]MDR6370416.1 putative membrane protein YphA (DoxX/SURF4 family) [Chryseobacterium vietnamense]MDR6441422.1 putative membrane protein YphA (DoxX/SURF4 family) [Chryseobacterium bernardetii]MDR6461516.1 putative membrane protein YphA (DoxX/SURF4 family) [Chryseobacterium vietnamense]TQM20376.1 DoxX-like protein [Chryseobacterium aquifrigidense]
MNTLVLIIQGLLALFFIMPGYGKISGSKVSHVANGHLKATSSIIPIRILGILELLGCIGIILPWILGIVPVLTPIAAVCFCIIMLAGMIIHTVKKEYKMLPMLVVVFVLSFLVAYYRFINLI